MSKTEETNIILYIVSFYLIILIYNIQLINENTETVMMNMKI